MDESSAYVTVVYQDERVVPVRGGEKGDAHLEETGDEGLAESQQLWGFVGFWNRQKVTLKQEKFKGPVPFPGSWETALHA